MNRKDAVIEIVKIQVKLLTLEERENYLIEWWYVDEDDDEGFNLFPKELRDEINNTDKCENPESKKYNPILFLALTYKFIGIKNKFIEKEYKRLIKKEVEIYGEIEFLERCPCCEYRTLEERGQYYICRVCFWEDDWTDELDKISGVNRMTLKEGKENFINFGACESRLIEFVEKLPHLKFEK